MSRQSVTAVGSERDRRASELALEALAPCSKGTHEITVGRTRLRVSNLHKVLYPQYGFTKLDLLRSYAQLAPVLLQHARARPLTLKRYPNGVDEEFFFQKRAPQKRPEWVNTTEPIGDQEVNYATLDDVRTLLWVANLASIELHVLLAKAATVQCPTAIVFDLDPGEGAGIVECANVALIVRDLFAELDLDCYAKTSGSKGIQLYAPLNVATVTYDDTKPFAKAVAELLAARHPDLIVSRQLKALRAGKVLIDWSQNDVSKTTVCAYSLRAREQPRVSTPVTWEEVETTSRGSDQEALRFETADVMARLAEHGDLFEPVVKQRQQLPRLG
ncbi:MAG: polymerase LigD polymerase domain [Thermoleophilia bacterium]|jgi:bifunctional non-homologous end joining protein LigD|nr:polymerase LigD polymerase domain [Thermoleophilia bacterium]